MDQRVFSRRYTWSHESGVIIIYRQTTAKHPDALAGQLGAGELLS